MIPRTAEAGSQCGYPSIVCAHPQHSGSNPRHHHCSSVTRIIVVGEPVESRLGTDDEGANLVIAADLAAAKERRRVAVGVIDAEYTVDHVTAVPAAAEIATD